MSINDDILDLVQFEENLWKSIGRYVPVSPTPNEIPTKGQDTKITTLVASKLTDPDIPFVLTAKDYQFEIRTHYQGNGVTDLPPTNAWITVNARRKLSEGVYEIVTTQEQEKPSG